VPRHHQGALGGRQLRVRTRPVTAPTLILARTRSPLGGLGGAQLHPGSHRMTGQLITTQPPRRGSCALPTIPLPTIPLPSSLRRDRDGFQSQVRAYLLHQPSGQLIKQRRHRLLTHRCVGVQDDLQQQVVVPDGTHTGDLLDVPWWVEPFRRSEDRAGTHRSRLPPPFDLLQRPLAVIYGPLLYIEQATVIALKPVNVA